MAEVNAAVMANHHWRVYHNVLNVLHRMDSSAAPMIIRLILRRPTPCSVLYAAIPLQWFYFDVLAKAMDADVLGRP